ncbi:long-chain fatty acid--CoA ligase [Ruegeria jejuensis]|uniref:long-chain fatty acid--CoA ligase n=1 Tax=Ruegeria jejuensis TaxID=3233338 RepID=UPI00355C234E
MTGTMMYQQLNVGAIIDHASKFHGDTEVVSVETTGGVRRSNWSEVARNARRLASALNKLGVQQGERVATIAWNNVRHLEIYFGVASGGMVCHTINPRLFPEQLVYIINHAEDQVLFLDKTFLPVAAKLGQMLKTVKAVVLMGPRDEEAAAMVDGLLFYDELLETGDPDYVWPDIEETAPASLCYTSGTTGNPKGVQYTHRSISLHALAIALPDALNLSGRDSVLPVVPMFHVSAWGIPYVAAVVGAKLVLPGPGMDGASLVNLIEAEEVTISLGVPTIWLGLLAEMSARGTNLPTMRRTVVGGSAMPPSMFNEFREKHGIEMIHAWGMTETSPLGTANQPKAKHAELDDDAMNALRMGQGRPPFGVDLRVVDDEGNTLANDGETQGMLQIKGHWIVDTYFGHDGNTLSEDGWFDTGDVATIDPDGYMVIRDRSKDIIKSGGEWISTVELENIAIGHPAIANAAAIAARHPKWDERPVIVAQKTGQITDDELIAFYDGKIAKWQMPDAVVFVEELPLGATGKVLKNKLREEFGDMLMP